MPAWWLPARARAAPSPRARARRRRPGLGARTGKSASGPSLAVRLLLCGVEGGDGLGHRRGDQLGGPGVAVADREVVGAGLMEDDRFLLAALVERRLDAGELGGPGRQRVHERLGAQRRDLADQVLALGFVDGLGWLHRHPLLDGVLLGPLLALEDEPLAALGDLEPGAGERAEREDVLRAEVRRRPRQVVGQRLLDGEDD